MQPSEGLGEKIDFIEQVLKFSSIYNLGLLFVLFCILLFFKLLKGSGNDGSYCLACEELAQCGRVI